MNVSAVVGGTVLTPEGPRLANVAIKNGTIAAIGEAEPAAGRLLDAAGCYVLPGGVDPHCHLMADVRAATVAAALGGTTTALSFTNPEAGEGDIECLLRRRADLATGRAAIDVGLHAMLYHPGQATAADLAAAGRAGAAAIKVFLAYPELGIMCSTRRLFELMSSATGPGMIVSVHCENGPLIEVLTEEALSSGRHGARVFADTRPPEVEEEAVARVLAIASLTGAACYLVHLSTAGAVDQVRLARKRGLAHVFAEVCLHHLLLDDRGYAGPDAQRYLVAPPLRAPRHLDTLWEAVADGTIDTVGSDHCQVRSATIGGLSSSGESYTYGLAGIGARLPLLLSAARARGIAVSRVVELASRNPARIFGHFPGKGALAAGSDADVVIYDPAGETTFNPSDYDDGTGDSVYAGLPLLGRIRAVLLRGRLIVSEGQFLAGERIGRYLAGSSLELTALPR